MEARIAKLESDMDHVKTTLDDIKVDIRDGRKDMNSFKDEMHTDFKWMTRMMMVLVGVIIAAIGMIIKF